MTHPPFPFRYPSEGGNVGLTHQFHSDGYRKAGAGGLTHQLQTGGSGGKLDHDRYSKNNNTIPKFMNFIKSLSSKLGKSEVTKAKRDHDKY